MTTPPERGVLARGLGRSYGDAAQNAGGCVVSMTGLAGIAAIDVPGARVTVDAGISLAALIGRLLPLGLFPAVTPGTRYVTVGGAIAADIHGKNHHRDGSFCQHVESLELLTPAGEQAVATPEANPDLFWATAGGMGLTGVILRATLRLLRVETDRVRVDIERAADLGDAMARMESGDAGYRYSVAWIDCLAGGRRLGRSVLMRGDHASRDELEPSERTRAPSLAGEPRLAAPRWAPPGLLRPSTVRAFNELWFRSAPKEERGRLEPLERFFYPLDAVRGWNRLYGPRGLIQYQLAVPAGRDEAVRAALERLRSGRCPSFLAVLKRFGPASGMLSFPLPGWTLALDVPADADGLAGLLDDLDEIVAEADGRVYLAKDSRLRPELLRTMYPELGRWRRVRAEADPGGLMRSDLSRRLGLA